MAHISQKITEFPARADRHPPQAGAPADFKEGDRGASRGGRSPIEELEAAVREARRNQRLAEDECDRLRSRLSEATGGDADVDLKALLRERDMLREQQAQYGPVIADLKAKLKAAETAGQTAQREREKEAQTLKKALHEKEEAVRQREANLRQRDLAREEKAAAIEKLAAAERNFSEAQKALAGIRKELGSAKKGDGELGHQIATLRQARDGMAAQIKDLQRKVEELEDHAAELSYSLDGAEKENRAFAARLEEANAAAAGNDADAGRIADLETQIEALRSENASLTQTAVELSEEAQRTADVLRQLREDLDAAVREKEAASRSVEEARTSTLAAQKQIEAIIRDRDTIRQQFSENAILLENQINQQTAEIARLSDALRGAQAKMAERDEVRDQFEKRRLDMIELTAQLDNAHREIRNLSASLAEARLLAKVAAKKAGTPAAGEPHKARPGTPSDDAHAGGDRPDTDSSGKDSILGLRRCFQTFSREPANLDLLEELKTRAQSLADSGRDQGHPILHRVCVAFVALLVDMRQVPDQISQGTLRTVNQTIELIAALVADPGIEQSVALNNARAYVVDDDESTCAMVVDALNMVGLKTDYALYSSAAVAELAGNRYDLIILDVHLPDLDGFELCAHIRNMAFHAETPVFFISGNTSLENRVKSSLRGGNEFIPKPFSIQELALKSLKSVISAQIQSH